MREKFRELVIKVLRIPPQPSMPAGSSTSLRVFRAAPNYYKYAVFKWVLAQIGALIGIAFALHWVGKALDWADKLEGMGRLLYHLIFWVEAIGITGYVFQIVATFMLIRLDYELRWYIVTDRSLRIREGVNNIREMTMTFANIQNIYIDQGPVQRMLGLANLRVQTAGGGGGELSAEGGEGTGESMHVGYFRGVDNAQEIRNLMLERLRLLKDSGLGNPDERPGGDEAEPPAEDSPVEAARELLAELRGLRQQLTAGAAR